MSTLEQELVGSWNLLKQHFMPMIELLDTFDPREAATFIQKAEETSESIASSEDVADLVEESLLKVATYFREESSVFGMLDSTLDDFIRVLEEELNQSAAARSCLQFFEDTNDKVPFLPLAIIVRTAKNSNKPQELVRLCEPADALIGATETNKQMRARRVMRALQDVAEQVYKPYLEELWYLVRVTEGRSLDCNLSFGQYVNALKPKLADYPGLLEEDAGWLRNAAAHGHFRYVPQSDSIVAWDKKHPETLFAVEDLLRIAETMYTTTTSAVFTAGALHMAKQARKYGFMKVLADAVRVLGKPEEFERFSQQLQTTIETGLEPLGRYVQTHYPEEDDA